MNLSNKSKTLYNNLVRKVSFFLLLVFSFLFAEDVINAHTAATDNANLEISHIIDFHSHNESHPIESSDSTELTHFGHCSFVLVSPLPTLNKIPLQALQQSHYFFSIVTSTRENLFRPPII